MTTPLIAVFWLSLGFAAFAHGRSQEMIRELNAPVPDWMSLAEPIKVESIEDQFLPAPNSFRPRSGGATNSRNRVQLPDLGIEFQVDYSITYTGNNAAGEGVSLSPDRTKLIVNSGTTPHLYEITPSGGHREAPIQLPHVTYDEGPKGFITKWSWASNEILVGHGEITDERGHELIEVRLYVFHLKEQSLARLDLGALKLPEDIAGLEIASIGNDLEHLRIRLGDREFAVKADLNSPPRLFTKPDSTPTPKMQSTGDPPGPEKTSGEVETSATPGDEPTLSIPWLVVAVVIVAAIGLLVALHKGRK